MEDWDLLAVVRGHNFNNTNMESPIFNNKNNNNMELLLPSPPMMSSSNSSCFALPYHQEQDDLLFNTFPHLFETNTAFDELEELYKPFYPGPGAADTVTRVASSSSLSSTSSSAISSFNSLPTQVDVQQHASPISNKPRAVKEPATKYKKRKNQQKRVVKEVREDGLSSDMWAWRKYGQKPIKGSPYPRSYYRCSSSKGCSARKQVERNPTNPEIFIITYTAEHTHAHPTRRNSLAGSTRCKFPNVSGSKPQKVITNNSDYCSSKDDIDDDGDDHKELALDNGDSASSEIDMKLDVVLGHNNGHHHQMMLASLDDLERGLEELDHEETSNNNNNDDDKSELLLDSRFFDDDQFIDANWFADQYNTTFTGAC